MKYMGVKAVVAVLALAVVMAAGNAYASKDEGKSGGEKAKVTLEQAIGIAKEKVPGEVVEVEYERGKRAYEVKIRTKDGVEKLYVDADDGSVRDTKGKKDGDKGGATSTDATQK